MPEGVRHVHGHEAGVHDQAEWAPQLQQTPNVQRLVRAVLHENAANRPVVEASQSPPRPVGVALDAFHEPHGRVLGRQPQDKHARASAFHVSHHATGNFPPHAAYYTKVLRSAV